MQSATFRKWLAERGCYFRRHERGHGQGHPTVTVVRDGRTAELPLVGSHDRLDPELVREVCERLGLDWSELPGEASRV
ncbi:hypothetical protein [Caldovatus aquaticus]|uniref:Type II toxin-antitoxin system HicA family toxin n=1 Tax=Caldovatus aquaticus TaxID=2865671 RepID=A0ABS7F0X4_9PROT|nr:hypothetical protein [Caldovatus aquaticus]MBW8269280.1 hypothetical protein [Caldovatus aquaticus]